MLRVKVAAGELSPVKQRLPEVTRTVEPVDEVDSKVTGNLAKGYELSGDAKSLTLYLRKGAKWSDGAPFTVDDII